MIEIITSFYPYHFLTLDKRRREFHLPEFGIRIIRSIFKTAINLSK